MLVVILDPNCQRTVPINLTNQFQKGEVFVRAMMREAQKRRVKPREVLNSFSTLSYDVRFFGSTVFFFSEKPQNSAAKQNSLKR